jgi:predicted nucleic acid-binding Zn ribbon protein
MEIKQCPKCLEIKNVCDFHSSKSRKISSYCKKCLYILQKRRWRERKFQAIKLSGGKCIRCGYCKCLNALEFHHRDKSTKEMDWSRLRMVKWKTIIEEIKKCDLLCSNCHREEHALEEDQELSGKDNSFLNREIKSTGICPVCGEYSYGTKFCSTECSSLGRRKVERPTREDLILLLKTISICAIGRKYGVSDNAVRKWAKFYGI